MFPAAFVPQLLGTVPPGTTILSCAILATPDAAASATWQTPPAPRTIDALRGLAASAELVGAASIISL
jgi:hypothetical protein